MIGGRIFNWRDYLDQAVFHADFNAQAAKFALGTLAQFLEGGRIEIGGMRIESAQHAVDGRGDQLLVGDWFYIVALDAPEHIGKSTQFLDGKRCDTFFFGHGRELQA